MCKQYNSEYYVIIRGARFSTFFSIQVFPLRKSYLTMPLRKSEIIFQIDLYLVVPHWRQTKLSKWGEYKTKRFRIVFCIEIDAKNSLFDNFKFFIDIINYFFFYKKFDFFPKWWFLWLKPKLLCVLKQLKKRYQQKLDVFREISAWRQIFVHFWA